MKNLIFAFLFISTISTVSAQENTDPTKKKFDFGIRHGYSSWDVSTESNSYSNLNLYVGLFVEKSISEKFSMRLETNYSRSSLLEIPLLLKYKISDKFEIYGGAELNFAFNKDNENNFIDKQFGGSLIFGAQYNINSHWFIDARYTHGFTDQFAVFNGFNNLSTFGKRRSLSFGVGYKF